MKRLTALGVAVGVIVVSAGAALAAWTIGSIGATGRGAARTLPAGPAPAAIASGSAVALSFAQVSVGGTFLGALSGGGYTVKRYSSGGALQIVNALCDATLSGSAPTLACIENGVADGTWLYRVTPVLAGWRGPESSPGTSVTVDTIPPTVTITSFAAASGGGNTKVTALGTGSPTDGKVRVYVCRANPCSSATAINLGDQNASVTVTAAGVWSYTSLNLGAGSYYVVAQQTDAAGNTGTSTTAGPVVR